MVLTEYRNILVVLGFWEETHMCSRFTKVFDQASCVEDCCAVVAECLQDTAAVFPPRIQFQIPLRVKIATGPDLAHLTPRGVTLSPVPGGESLPKV
jgi:hypothetical protein